MKKGLRIYTKKDIPRINQLKEEFEKLIISFRGLYYPGKNPTRFLGEYGELLVQPKLLNNFDIEMFGGQSPADLRIVDKKDSTNKKNIEVKLSSCKGEGWGEGWAFAINAKKGKVDKAIKDFSYFDYLICIGLDKDYANPKFYIFTQEEIQKHEKEMRNDRKGGIKRGRYSGSHGLIIPHEPSGKEYIPNFFNDILNNPNFLENWDKIK
ncbi:hypothetical protein J4226_01875 [Candidatus Pacearchaeota archaeon]|nr:hypothetical protein [Candidatus Pacearchaeota archaeon]